MSAYAWTPRDVPFAVMVKAVRCLRYQCSEGPLMRTDLCGRLDGLCQGYEATSVYDTAAYRPAPWGLKEAECAAGEATFRSEITPEGEQLVIPGCERNQARTRGQLDLFG